MTRGAPIPDTVTLHVPFRVVKRGGKKEMQMPEGATQSQRIDNTLVKALARAFRWKRMLESCEFATIAELAEREGIAPSYMTRVLRLSACRYPLYSSRCDEFDFCSFLTNATGIEVLNRDLEKGTVLQLLTRNSLNSRSHEVRRILARRDRFQATQRRVQCSALPA